MKNQLYPSADGNSGPKNSRKAISTRPNSIRPLPQKILGDKNFVMMDSETAHFFCDHDFKFKMLGGHLCKFCGIGKTPTSLGIKSNLLACKVYTNSICHDNLPDASKKFQKPHDEVYLAERADFIFFMHQVRLDFEIDQQAFHLGCQIMDMLFTVENAESITS